MQTPPDQIIAHLHALRIPFDRLAHPPVRSMADCAPIQKQLGGIMPKNLLLCPRNQSTFVLCLLRPDAPFRTADISKQLSLSRLTFAAAPHLAQYLRTTPNALSPLGLMFPESAPLRLAIDATLLHAPRLLFHPNISTETLALSASDFFNIFLPATHHTPSSLQIAPC